MATVRDIIGAALRELGVLAEGADASAAQAADGLVAINNLVDQYAAERLEIYTITRTLFTITATQDYTVGSGGTVNVARPIFIEGVGLVDTAPAPDLERALTPFTDDGWRGVPNKALTATQPSNYYYNPTFGSTGFGTLSLWPIPTSSGSGFQGALYAPAAVAEFASINVTISLPPGYRRMLIKNLAVDLAPNYGRQPSQALMEAARDSKSVVKRSNERLADLSFPASSLIQGGGYSYDINTDA